MLEISCIESFSHEIITIFVRIFSCKSILYPSRSLSPQIDSTVVNQIQHKILIMFTCVYMSD